LADLMKKPDSVVVVWVLSLMSWMAEMEWVK
jgi:hypothetical protein